MIGAPAVAERLAAVRARISAAGRDPASVLIVAVTKGFPAEAAAAAVGAGLADVGENYAQELLAKAPSVQGARWHFLGPVQRNKVKGLAPVVELWHGVDRMAAGQAIARAAPGAAVLVQVNLAGEPGRPGCAWSELDTLVADLRTLELDVRGLMGVAPLPGAAGAGGARSSFRRLAGAAHDLGLAELSMGMSDDLEAALAEGATIVRLGRALFGPRPQPAQRAQ